MTTTDRTLSRPIAEGLFTWPADEPRLLGSRCTECRTVVFPAARSCPRCGSVHVESHQLPRRGRLFTFTTQGFLPKEPYRGPETEETFTGFALGYVELDDEVMVESRLTEPDPERLEIGMEMELVVVLFRRDPDGADVMTFAFAPIEEGVPS
jgi:uncharacterized OB-fold protein